MVVIVVMVGVVVMAVVMVVVRAESLAHVQLVARQGERD